MSHAIQVWLRVAQRTLQAVSLMMMIALAAVLVSWSSAALLGWAPWLQMQVGLGSATAVEAGVAIQTSLTLLLVGLCFFLPTNARVMRLERSHRDFKVSMWDVARAYKAVHAADRHDAFELRSEFDSLRDRLTYLRNHSELAALEPEILELAAQMSHESRELAQVFSDSRVGRARTFLKQRQEEAKLFQERVQLAHGTCRELKRWLDNVQVEEAVAQSQLRRLQDDLEELLPALGMTISEKTAEEPAIPGHEAVPFRVAAE